MQSLNRTAILFLFLFATLAGRAQSLAWVKTIEATGAPFQVNNLATDASGNSYVIGALAGTADFDPGPGTTNLTSAGGLDLYFAKYNAAGVLAWARRIGGTGIDRGTGIAVDAAGNVFITGAFRGTVDLDAGSGVQLATAAGSGFDPVDMLIAKYNASGDMLWTKVIGGDGTEYSEDLAVDGSGNLLLSAQLDGVPVDYDPGPGVYTLSAPNGGQTALLKLDGNGNFLWARQIGNGGSAYPEKMRTDASGAIYLSGSFTQTVDFDPGTGTFPMTANPAGPDGYVLKLAADGSFSWATMVTGYDGQNVFDLAIDATGAVYATGFYKDATDFDAGPANTNTTWQGDREGFLWKISPNGSFAWVRTFVSPGADQVLSVDVDPEGFVFLAGQFSGSIDFDPDADVQNMDASNGATFICKFSPAGDLVWARQLAGAQPSASLLRTYAPDAFVLAGLLSGAADFDPGPGVQTVTPAAGTQGTVFLWKLAKSNQISGTVFIDTNGDGIRQPGEAGAPTKVTAIRNGILYETESDTNGVYRLDADPGTYSVSVPLPVHFSSVLPTQHSAVFSGNGELDTANHFALQPVAGISDLAVWLSAASAARPGRSTYYVLRYQNKGTVPASGSIRVQADPRVQFETASPAAATDAGGIQTWTFTNLPPLHSGQLLLQYRPQTAVGSGTQLQHIAMIEPTAADAFPADNSDTLRHTVTASFDPNDKSVFPEGEIPPSFVSNGNYLDYTIRFQNTGNDTAFVVIVRDTLSNLLDLSSLDVVSASHPYRLQLGKDHDLEWQFNNILLPDSTVNEPRSHGFIRYRLRLLSGAQPNDVVRNRASIYFDFNSPVRTQETATRISVLTAVPVVADIVPLRVYPVPARHVLHVVLSGKFSWTLVDLAGRPVRKSENARDEAQVPLGGLPCGSYLLRLQTSRGSLVRTVLIQ